MEERSLRVLEFAKIRDRLAAFASFSIGRERALALLPVDDIRLVRAWQAETSEAQRLLEEKSDVHLGGVHDLRPQIEQAVRGGVLVPTDLLEVRSTLQRAHSLQRSLTRVSDAFPHVADVAARIAVPQHVIDEVTRCIDERGEVLDSASEALERIRRQLRESHSRLLDRLQRLVTASSNQPYLQEPIVTQRQGRYVIPLRAEFKGRIPGLVHDQSGSGATLFIEPIAVVDLNNQWREAQLAEQEEIRRILSAITEAVAAEAEPIRRTLDALGELDFIFAKGRYAHEVRGVEPDLVDWTKTVAGDQRLPSRKASNQPAPGVVAVAPTDAAPPIRHPGSTIDLKQARHPLLDPVTVVPVDIYLDEDFFALVITGPNTGGKTVSLKTTGLLILMAQAGLAIPAEEGSKLSVFEEVLADIGDEQSIEQSLSTFSSHMTHIVHILDAATPQSLVLLDELGAGTDPEEGAALAQALLKTLLARSITTLATTHYSELKVFAHNTPYVTNASVEFDIESLSPTYRLSIGLPGRSNAFAIARRLGLPEPIVQQAEALVSPEALETETMLAEIKRAREAALEAELSAKLARSQAEALNADLRYRLGKVEEARREVLADARAAAAAELDNVRQEIARVQEGLSNVVKGQTRHEAWLAEAEEVLARRAADLQPLPSAQTPSPLVIDGPLLPGDMVWVPSLQASGQVATVGPNDVEVNVGSFRIKLAHNRVELRQRGGLEAIQAGPVAPRPPNPGMELDLRGLTVDDMLLELDRYLDSAYRAGLPFVRIIHGKGTGALRQAVRDELRHHPLVSEYRAGENNEGGEGVTVAKLVQR
jgi:DNA mismatch repair protein MutS2